MIRIENISKSYGKVQALDDLNIHVQKGQLYGLIGPDGAGKTTLFRILTSLLIPNSGTASLMGYDCVKDYKNIRNIVGYMPGNFSLYLDLSVEENLNFFATIFNTTIEENYHLIEDIYKMLEPFKHRRAGDLSGGMKQKLALSCALIHKPDVLLLDEPTTGVDPVSRKEFWEMLKKLQAGGLTTFVSTPFLDDAQLCDEVALIQNGKLLSVNTPQNIANSFPHKLWKVVTHNNYASLNALHNMPNAISSFAFGDSVHLATEDMISQRDINNHLQKVNIQAETIEQIEPSIEDTFMELMS
jgi:ABC-type multidrug transport system ATPase subunit